MNVKYIGVKKGGGLKYLFIGLISFILTFTCVILWGVYLKNYADEILIRDGVEVEATIVRYESWKRGDFKLGYEYVSEDGKVYIGHAATVTSRKAAEAAIGKKITIVIDPNSTLSRPRRLDQLGTLEDLRYESDLITAIVASCIALPIALYMFSYRLVYRSVLDSKIRRRLPGNVNDYLKANGPGIKALPIVLGEVVKVRGWLIKYVKVNYWDENDERKEKWARAWFTRKEAKFLERKKFINIALYKNTYGIVEQMY